MLSAFIPLAMILPVQLGAATADACTSFRLRVTSPAIYALTMAGSSFGSYAAGDVLDVPIRLVCTASYVAAMLVASSDGNC